MAEKKQEKIQENKEDLFDILTDEDNADTIVLFDENNKQVEFEQIAVIPFDNNLFAILKPITEMEGVGADEAIVFRLEKDEKNESSVLVAEENEKTAEAVFEEYYKLFDEDAE